MAGTGRKQILVLQTRFSEFGESAAAYKACQRLARDGHDVLTTTTTTDRDELAKEREAAKALGRRGGAVTLVTPESDAHEESRTEWITTRLYKAYFSELLTLRRVHTVVTLMPGTTKTGVDLTKELRKYGKVKLVLLTCTKLALDQGELYSEIEEMIQLADEIWSMGPDLYAHYNELFAGYNLKRLKKIQHKELIFMPSKTYAPGIQRFWKSFYSTGSLVRVVSLWQEGTPYQYKGNMVKAKSHGSSLQDYFCLCKALGKISSELSYRKQKIEWEILGPQDIVKSMIPSIKSNQTKGKHTFPINGFTLPTSSETFCTKRLRKSTMFIAPEKTEDTFNFAAYEAIKFGIPTLVSSESSLGRVLGGLPQCTVAPRALVELTGDQQHDVEQWKKAIYEHILSDPEEARAWARELSKFLADSPEIRSYEEDVFGPPGGVTGYRGSSLDVDDNSSGTTLSDESPKSSSNVNDAPSATRPSSVSTFSPAGPSGEPGGRVSSSWGTPAGEPETRPRSSSFGKQYGPVRPTYLHDDTEDLTSMFETLPSSVAGAQVILRRLSRSLTSLGRPGPPTAAGAGGLVTDGIPHIDSSNSLDSRIKHETASPYSPIPEHAAKTISATLRERQGPRLPRPSSDPFRDQEPRVSRPSSDQGSPRVPRSLSSPYANRLDVVGPRTLKRTTPPGTPPSYEGERRRAERTRSLSGGGRKNSAHTSPPPALLDSSMVCAAHQKYFEFYCEDSLTPLCVDCANEPYHAMKGIVRLTEVEAKLKVSMKTSHHQASVKHRDLHHRRAALREALQNIQNQSTIAIRKINQRKDFTYEMLERIASSMIAHVRSTALDEQQKIEDELAHIEESMKQTKRQYGAMNAVLHATPSTEFIKQAKVVLAENENNQVQKFSSPVQGIHTLEFLPALISINDPSRAQVLIEDCLLGHLKRKSEEIFMPSDSMLNVFDHRDGRGYYYSPTQLGASFYGTQYHDESMSSVSSFRSLEIGDRDDELSLGSDFEEEQRTRSKSEPDIMVSKESAQALEQAHHEEVLSFTVNKKKPILPPATASFIGSVPISSIKPALEEVLDICQSADGIWICGHYTPERWKTPHLCICKLNGSDQKVALVYDIDAKDASRPAVLLDSNGKLIYAKRKDWRIFEINPNDPKQRPTVTYSMVTQRIGALTGAGKHMFFSDVSPENQGCIQFLKWKSSDLRYKRTVHTNLSTGSHETIHLGLVCSPTSPSPSRAPDPIFRAPAEEQEPEVCMLIVSDSGDEKNVIAVDTDGYVHWQLAGHNSELLQGDGSFEPAGVCADNRCNVYVADRANSRILVVTPNGKDVHCLLDRKQGIEEPSKLCLAMDGQQLAVLNKKGQEIALYDIDIR